MRFLPKGMIKEIELLTVVVLEDIKCEMQEVLNLNERLITQGGQHDFLSPKAARFGFARHCSGSVALSVFGSKRLLISLRIFQGKLLMRQSLKFCFTYVYTIPVNAKTLRPVVGTWQHRHDLEN